jgi:hypothetical protein
MNEIRAMFDFWDGAMELRKSLGNRLSAFERGVDNAPDTESVQILRNFYARAEAIENEADEALITMARREYPIFEQLTELRGVADHTAALMVSMIDINRCPTVSSLWKYSGFGVVNHAVVKYDGKDRTFVFNRETDQLFVPDKESDNRKRAIFEGKPVSVLKDEGVIIEIKPGQHDRKVAGQLLTYNARLKTLMHIVATNFMRSKSPYRAIYDRAKARAEQSHAGDSKWPKGRIHLHSMRIMKKVFLSHLWVRWRELEGLPTRSLYVEEHLNHSHIYKPEEFGWSVVKATDEAKELAVIDG